MTTSVQARLDEKTQKTLRQLVRELGWSPSRVVREGVMLLAACRLGTKKRQVIGAGKFESGIPDLGSNKKHLEGFGK